MIGRYELFVVTIMSSEVVDDMYSFNNSFTLKGFDSTTQYFVEMLYGHMKFKCIS